MSIKCIFSLKNLLFFFLIFSSTSYYLSQGLFSPSNIKNIKVQELNEQDIKQIKSELDKQKMSIETAENLAITNGMSPSDFATLKMKIENIQSSKTQLNTETGTKIEEKPIEFDEESNLKRTEIFGSELFNNTSLSFEPNSTNATPSGYVLGPGDELQIIVYGMQEYSANSTVSKEGTINLQIIGEIFVNGLTIEAAKIKIKKACSNALKSLNTGQSNLSISLSKIRTIRVTILGARKPGNYSVSSLSTVFNALHIAGGPNDNGSYRNIELVRNNKVIKKIDIYKFLLSGDQSDNINLIENDVIRIPVYENRVKIEGKVKRPGIFELLPNENFDDLLRYCSGFDEAAYRGNIKLIQNTDRELKILDLTEQVYKNYKPKLGDIFKVSTILNRFENKVSIKGAVFRPDDYELTEGMTIKTLIEKADGLTEDSYKNRAILIREKEDLTKEMMNVNLNASLELKLKKNDELIITSLFELKNQQSVTITGQVKKPGEYAYIQNITLYDLILLAGGFTEGSSKYVEIATLISKDEPSKNNTAKSTIKTIEIDTLLLDNSKNVMLSPDDFVQIRKKPIYEKQEFVSISGEVEYPGRYVIADKKERILDLIKRSGGLKFDANENGIQVKRFSEKMVNDTIIKTEILIPVDYNTIKNKPNSRKNFRLQKGDEIIVAREFNNVKIFGNVQLVSEIPFTRSKGLAYYINAVGGTTSTADKKRIYVVYPNGIASKTRSFIGIKNYPKIKPGSQIVVPQKDLDKSNKMSTAELSAIIGVFGSLVGMTVAIINLTK
jgi:protein involved in polysaccharide export with SLBB domain